MIEVHVVPRASGRGIVGRHGDAVRVRVTAPPTDGRANREALEAIADALGVPNRAVRLVRGSSSRRKAFAVDGDERVLADRLAACLAAGGRPDGPSDRDRPSAGA